MANVKERAIYDHFDRHQERYMKSLREVLLLDECPRLSAMMPAPIVLQLPAAPRSLPPPPTTTTTPGLHIIPPIYPIGPQVISAPLDLARLKELRARAPPTVTPNQ